MNPQGKIVSGLCFLGLLGTGPIPASGQDYGSRLGLRQGNEYSYAPEGPRVMLNSVDPAMRKWYLSQELYRD